MIQYFCMPFVKKIICSMNTFSLLILLHAASSSLLFAMDSDKANLYTKLWEYAKSDQTLSEFQDIIDNNNDLDINQKNKDGQTVLHIAADNGAESIVAYLLEPNNQKRIKLNNSNRAFLNPLKIKINAQDNHWMMALHLAIIENHLKIARMLLEAGALLNRGHIGTLHVLYFAAAYAKDKEFMTFIIQKSQKTQFNIDTTLAKESIASTKEDTDEEDTDEEDTDEDQPSCTGYDSLWNGQTPLTAATRAGNRPAVEALLEAGVQISVSDYWGENALHYAARLINDKEFLQLLIQAIKKQRFDIDTQAYYATGDDDIDGSNTPLSFAITNNNKAAIEALIEAGAQLNVQLEDNNHATRNVLHVAVEKYPRDEIAALMDLIIEKLGRAALIEAIATPSDDSLGGITPLHLAAKIGNLPVLQYFIKKENVFWSRSQEGYNVLDYAALNQQLEVIDWLLKEDTLYQRLMFDTSAQVHPFHLAAKEGHSAVLESMIKHLRSKDKKSFMKLKDHAGEDVWSYALKSGDVYTVKVVFDFMKDTLNTNDFNEKLLSRSISAPNAFEGKDFPLCFAAKKGYYPIVHLLKNFLPSHSPVEKMSCGVENCSIACASIILNEFPDLQYHSTFITGLHPIHAAAKNNFFNWLPLFANENSIKFLDENEKTALDLAYDVWTKKAKKWVSHTENIPLEDFFSDSNVLIYLMLESLPVFVKDEDLQNEYLGLMNSFQEELQSMQLGNQQRMLHLNYILEMIKIILNASADYHQEPYQGVYEKLALQMVNFFNQKQKSLSNDFPSAHYLQVKNTYEQHIGYVFFHPRMLSAFRKVKNFISIENFTQLENLIRLGYAKTILDEWLMQIPKEAAHYIFPFSENTLRTGFEKIVSNALSNSKESISQFTEVLNNQIAEKKLSYHLATLNDYIKNIYVNHKPWQSSMTKNVQEHLKSVIGNQRIVAFAEYVQSCSNEYEQVQPKEKAQKPSFGFYTAQVSSAKFILEFYKDLKKIITNKGQLHRFESVKSVKPDEVIDILPS